MKHQAIITLNELPKLETLYHNANGYLGIRNSPEEGHCPESIPGAFINGFYEMTDLRYEEKLFGFPETKQVLVNLPNVQTTLIDADGEAYSLFADSVVLRQQFLDTEEGVTLRHVIWNTKHGKLELNFRRMASFLHPNLFLMIVELVSHGYEGPVCLRSVLESTVSNRTPVQDDPRVANQRLNCLVTQKSAIENGKMAYSCETMRSHLRMECRAAHEWAGNVRWEQNGDSLSGIFEGQLKTGETLRLVKYVIYTDSLRSPQPDILADELLAEVQSLGWEKLLREQKELLRELRKDAFPKLYAPEPYPSALDYDLFELLQSTGCDSICSVAAKGLSGEGYEGHVFWDCESYVFPFFMWTQPEKARGILNYRVRHLELARQHARTLGVDKGAIYPWRTISGTECSPYYPSGSAQYHINGDIAYAFIQYWHITHDSAFMADGGADVLVETARAWLELGHMEKDGFRIDCVTGPDEYTCCVNNNFYTNAVARYNLLGAALIMAELRKCGEADAVIRRTGITAEEEAAFLETGNHMYLPYDEELGISAQDDSFLHKKKLDFKSLPRENFPLLMHYHPLFLYRHQVCKQADTVLAHLMFPELVDEETRRRSYDYYESVTTHDSSLSVCVYGMMGARLGDMKRALEGFEGTATLDLLDTHMNTRDGLHTASMGGAYLCLVRGFSGMSLNEKGLHIDAKLPDGWEGYDLPFTYLGERKLLRVRRGKKTEIL